MPSTARMLRPYPNTYPANTDCTLQVFNFLLKVFWMGVGVPEIHILNSASKSQVPAARELADCLARPTNPIFSKCRWPVSCLPGWARCVF